MLNLNLGREEHIGGSTCISADFGTEGHVVFGPYVRLEPGHYVISFVLSADMDHHSIGDRTCAILDVVSHYGKLTYARQSVTIGEIADVPTVVPLTFAVHEAAEFEFRVLNLGEAALRVWEHQELTRIPQEHAPKPQRRPGYPTLADGPLPTRLLEDNAGFHALYERGADIRVDGLDIVIDAQDAPFVANDLDLDAIGRRLWSHGMQIDVSYADADEDVILLNALRDVPRDRGFYIDVGANDPEIISVTKLFYDRGWRGINVEPSPKWYARLVEARPRDINIQAAVSDEPGEVTFFDHTDGGLGTMVQEYAELHHQQRGVQTEAITVSTMSLTDICARHAAEDIHFLKVDVEGHEAAVLRSMDFGRYRPWILCIEATEPMNVSKKTFDRWDRIVTRAGYLLARSDHLNRYYVAHERSHLLQRFRKALRGYVKAAS